jgi:DNA polymerase IV (family X)
MTESNTIADELEKFSDFLRLDEQDGRAYAYETAAQVLRRRRVIPPDPSQLDGIGDSTRTTIAEYQHSGTIDELEELCDEYPWYDAMRSVNGIGQARAQQIHEKFNVESLDDLILVGSDLTLISGIGQVTAANIIESAREERDSE